MLQRLFEKPGRTTAAAIFVLALFSFMCMAAAGAGPWNNRFIDTDDFTRALKILAFMKGQPWWEAGFPSVFGHIELHWTRPTDLAVLAFASPLQLLGLDPKSALLWASFISPPLILALFGLAWMWVGRALSDDKGEQAAMGLGAVFMISAAQWFAPMRIDHHALILTVATVLLGFSIRALRGSLKWHGYILAGLIAAFAVWVSIEELLMVGLFLLSLGLGWLLRGGVKEAVWNALMAGSMTIGMAVAVFIERGPHEFASPSLTIDKVSLFHLVLFGGVAVGWVLMALLQHLRERKSDTKSGFLFRCFLGVVGASLSGVILYLLQPQVFHGNVATNIDPLYVAMRSGFIKEGEKVITLATFAHGDWQSILYAFAGDFLPAVIGVAGLLYLLAREPRERKMAWLAIAVWLAFFLGWQGWPTNANALWLNWMCALPLSVVLWRLASALPVKRERVVLLASFALVLLHLGLGGRTSSVTDGGQVLADAEAERPGTCNFTAAISALELEGFTPGATVLSFPDIGPQTAWRLDAVASSIPNHHRQPGFDKGYEVFMSGNAEEARPILKEMGVKAIILCDRYIVRPYFGLKASQGATFGKALLARQVPDWLHEVPLAGADNRDTRLYRADP